MKEDIIMFTKDSKIELLIDKISHQENLSLGIVGSRNIEIDVSLMKDIFGRIEYNG